MIPRPVSFISIGKYLPLKVIHAFSGVLPSGLTPGLLTDSDAFSAPTVARGAVALTPSLISDSDAFYAITVSAGAVALTPGIITDSDAFYAPSVGGAVQPFVAYASASPRYRSRSVPLAAVTDYIARPPAAPAAQPFVSYASASPRYRYRTIPSASVTDYILPGRKVITPGLLVDTDSLFIPSSTYILTGISKFNDADSFPAPSITKGSVLLPSLFTDGDVLFAPIVGTHVQSVSIVGCG